MKKSLFSLDKQGFLLYNSEAVKLKFFTGGEIDRKGQIADGKKSGSNHAF